MSSINRKPHVLRAEKTLAMPRHVILVDTESDQFVLPNGSVEHRLKLGWACYYRRGQGKRRSSEEWLYFTNPWEFWTFVFDKCNTKNRLWVIAHNISFDFTLLDGFGFLRLDGFKCRFFYSKGITTVIKVTKKGSSIVFVDSLNWFRESLEKIGDRIDIPKITVDFDQVEDSQLNAHCKRDVEILIGVFKLLCNFLESNRISRLCYTIGSTAMAAYLLKHYRGKIWIHNNEQAIDLERDSYKGGRTECFYIGDLTDGPYYVLDVNALYPFVMRDNLFPVKYRQIIHGPTISDMVDYLERYSVVASVYLDTVSPIYAVKSERTLFPVGQFTACLCSPEIRVALALGDIKSISTAVIYDQAKIFTSFVNRFYELRQEFNLADNPIFEHFCKILMNSLYGKFGQKAETWKKIGVCPGEPDRIEDIYDVVTYRRKQLRYLLGEVFELIGFDESRHSFPAISSHVTAYARLHLWSIMEMAGHENYYYCDTDSLFVNRQGLDNLSDLLHDTEIGKLKLEYETDTITIHGLKDYVTAHGQTIKGIRKNAILIANDVYTQDSWPSIKGVLRNIDTSIYTVNKIEKYLEREYTKGNISPSGFVRPFVFDESHQPESRQVGPSLLPFV